MSAANPELFVRWTWVPDPLFDPVPPVASDTWAVGLRDRIEQSRLQPLDSTLRGLEFGVNEGEIVDDQVAIVAELPIKGWQSEAEYAAGIGVAA